MIYLHSYYIQDYNYHYHDFYNTEDDTYYSITIENDTNEIHYYKGIIDEYKYADFYRCNKFEYKLPKNIININYNDNDNYDNNKERYIDLNNSKLRIALNSI